MKFIPIILFIFLPTISFAEINNQNNIKPLIIHTEDEARYDIQSIIYIDNIKKVLPKSFGQLDLPNDLKITSFTSGNGIKFNDYAINKNGIIYVIPSEGEYKKMQDKDTLEKNSNGQVKLYSFNVGKYGKRYIVKDQIIKGFLKNQPIIIYLKIYWYDVPY